MKASQKAFIAVGFSVSGTLVVSWMYVSKSGWAWYSGSFVTSPGYRISSWYILKMKTSSLHDQLQQWHLRSHSVLCLDTFSWMRWCDGASSLSSFRHVSRYIQILLWRARSSGRFCVNQQCRRRLPRNIDMRVTKGGGYLRMQLLQYWLPWKEEGHNGSVCGWIGRWALLRWISRF